MCGIHTPPAVRAGRNDVVRRVRAGSPSGRAAMSLASSSTCCRKAFRPTADHSRFAAVKTFVGPSANSTARARAVLSRSGSGTRRETDPSVRPAPRSTHGWWGRDRLLDSSPPAVFEGRRSAVWRRQVRQALGRTQTMTDLYPDSRRVRPTDRMILYHLGELPLRIDNVTDPPTVKITRGVQLHPFGRFARASVGRSVSAVSLLSSRRYC
ncbi:hypothetical protein QFZ32_002050 [Streptomyces canus]|nr:hypothetical protein [Streptomyces canus]